MMTDTIYSGSSAPREGIFPQMKRSGGIHDTVLCVLNWTGDLLAAFLFVNLKL